MTNDEQLLHAYARERSESAFGELVGRHIDFVYSTALRVLNGDSHLAQDVAQTVFIDLARKAGSLPGGVDLTGWLHRHTCYIAATAVRTERRRQSREQTAMEMRALDDNTRPEWEQVAPYLDESLNQLNPADRDALVRRFLKQQDLRAVGAALGISDDAAQKRVDRALEKLHVLLKHRGATLSVAALGTALATEAVTAAPAGLAGAVTTAALSGTTITSVVTAAKAIAMTTLQKTLITATVAVLAGAGLYEARQAANARAEVQTLQQQKTSFTEQIQQLQSERDDSTNRLAGLMGEHLVLNSSPNQRELLKLRGEIGVLRRENDELKRSQTKTQTYPQQSHSPAIEPAGLPTDYPTTPDGATKSIFELMARGDWNGFTNFDIEGGREVFEQALGDKGKERLRGMEIVSVGQPTNSFGPNLWFVPYTIRFQDGNEKSFRLHVAQDPRTQRWTLKGGF